MIRTIVASTLSVLIAVAPAYSEPVENGTEIAQLLAEIGDRCWAVDIDGQVFDAAALSEIEGPIDIELECIVDDKKASATKPLPNSVI